MKFSRAWVLITMAALIMWSVTAMAGGPVGSVKGHFKIAACCPIAPDPIIRYREFFVFEGNGKSLQKGYMYSITSNDNWFMMDFNDTENTCVKVIGNGVARLGGLVSDGNVGAVGKYFGFEMQDWKKPPLHHDSSRTFRFFGPDGYGDLVARDHLMEWCETGEHEGRVDAIWPAVVVKGNLTVQKGKTNGD